MIRVLGRRLAHLVPVLLLVSFATMVMLDLIPGEPAYAILGESATPEQVAQVNHELGLDKGLLERYGDWLGGVLTGDFGTSLRTNQAVWDAISERLPVTIELAVLAQLLALVVAIPVAVFTAQAQGGRGDRWWAAVSSLFIATPSFVLALVLAYVLSVRWHVFPVTGWVPIEDGLGENLRTAFLPALALALGEIAVYSRLLRADMITTLQNDYVLAAQAKGLTPMYVLFRHALRPSSFSLVTLSGLSLGRLVGGTVVVETIFALPGLGQLTVQSTLASDLVMIQGIVVFVALVYVIINALVDMAYAFLDPRVRMAVT